MESAAATPQAAADTSTATAQKPSSVATGVPSSTNATTTTSAVGTYIIGAQDVLDVSVFNVPDLSRSVQVSDSGVINYPLVGDVAVAGKTAHDVEIELVAKLGAKYLKSPHVTVFVKEFNSQHVTVDGAVRKSGVFPLRGTNTLLQVVAQAGGLDPDLAASGVVVFRQTPTGQQTLTYDMDSIRSGKTPDPQLQNGDSVIVKTSDGKVFMNNVGKVSPFFNLLRVP